MLKKLPLLVLALAACRKPPAPTVTVYQAVPVERRDIVVSARANGTLQPDTLVEVKSQASGEVLRVMVETGQVVRAGDLMVHIDPRIPRNNLDQSESQLEVAKARLVNAQTQKDRSEALLKSQSITQTEYDQAVLDYATAKAGVVTAQVNLQNAQITLDQTDVRAPITGTIVELDVERGQVISSPISTVGGGTVLLRMADLNRVQVSTLVDETDIGKVQPGLQATVTVNAYPNRPFSGQVLKIEPQATVQQNVTMFPVLVRIENRAGLLKPGMNADVEVHVGRRDSVLAIPVGALRTPRDAGSAAQLMGLSDAEVKTQLASAEPRPAGDTAVRTRMAATAEKPAGTTMSLPDGRSVTLPSGVTEDQVRAIFRKRMSGEDPTPAERALLRQVFQGGGGSGGGRGEGGRGGNARGDASDSRFGGKYIVFVKREGRPYAVNITTGLTDLDYSEVTGGLTEQDSVLILPSASLIAQQKDFNSRMQRVTGGGGIPGMTASGGGKAPAPGGRP